MASALLSVSLFDHMSHTHCPSLPSFPTRRSSDLQVRALLPVIREARQRRDRRDLRALDDGTPEHAAMELEPVDRKSTRLNSSHLVISYAVFCLKKKK